MRKNEWICEMFRGNSEPDTVMDWIGEQGSHYSPPGPDHLLLDPTEPPSLSSYMSSPRLPCVLHWQPHSPSPNTILTWFLPSYKPTEISHLWFGHLFSPENVIVPTSTSHSNSRPARCPPTWKCLPMHRHFKSLLQHHLLTEDSPEASIILFLTTLTRSKH